MRKKFLKLCLGSLCFSMLFNLISNNGIKFERFGTGTYWVFTVPFAVAIIIAAILARFSLKISWIKWQKKYPELELFKEGRVHIRELPSWEKVLAILLTAVVLQLAYLCIVYCIGYVRRDYDPDVLFKSYLKHYMPFIAICCICYIGYVFKKGELWWFTPQNAIVVFRRQLPEKIITLEKVVEKEIPVVNPSVLDEKIPVGSLYDILYNHAKFEHDFTKKTSIRMFDVPFYFSTKGQKEVILMDGKRRRAERFMQELEVIGLDKWYFRISSTCRVNMMLIRYPVLPNATQLEFRKEVFANLHAKMTELEIQNLLVVSQWIRKSKRLTKFLDNVNNLEHKGWDHLIPLN